MAFDPGSPLQPHEKKGPHVSLSSHQLSNSRFSPFLLTLIKRELEFSNKSLPSASRSENEKGPWPVQYLCSLIRLLGTWSASISAVINISSQQKSCVSKTSLFFRICVDSAGMIGIISFSAQWIALSLTPFWLTVSSTSEATKVLRRSSMLATSELLVLIWKASIM